MAISSDLFRGHTETIILKILKQADNYGYDITKQIKEKSLGYFDIKDATIYTAFKRMEACDFIATYWGDGVGGARRRYYSITEKGLQEYIDRLQEWKVATEILSNLIGGKDGK